MKRDYLSDKEAKKKTTKQGIVVLVIFIIIFFAVIFRFAIRSGTNAGFFRLMPTGKDAFQIAKDYVKTTLKSPNIDFPEQDYQFSKNSDSVYVIKSYFEGAGASSTSSKTNFTITLKYNGGFASNDENWKVVSLEETR